MAKQKGIHQLKGKVGGMSYYQQSGVTDGLVRRIPEGLSSRVKTADEYANTRLNNDEFKNGNAMATFAFRAVPNRKASMMRRFAIAEMTKSALEFIKSGTGQWGQRIPTETFDNIMVDMLERHAKTGPYAGEFGTVVVSYSAEEGILIELSFDSSFAAEMASKGIDGFYCLAVRGCMCSLIGPRGFVRNYFGLSSINPTNITSFGTGLMTVEEFKPDASTLGMTPGDFATAAQTPNNGIFDILSFIPYRQIGDQRHNLYEYATYTCLALGAIPE